MNRDEVLADVKEIVYEVAGVSPDSVTPEKSFKDDLDIDSLSMVEISVAAEEKFGIEIPDDSLKTLKTVGEVIDYVLKASPEAAVT
jgi:acyl carrier protein